MYQVILERKSEDYIEKYILAEVETEEHARAVIAYMVEERPPVLKQERQLIRFTIQQAVSIWDDDVFRLMVS